jgi:hypothetical protein
MKRFEPCPSKGVINLKYKDNYPEDFPEELKGILESKLKIERSERMLKYLSYGLYFFFIILLSVTIINISYLVLISPIHSEIKKAIVSPEVFAAVIGFGGAFLTYLVQQETQIKKDHFEYKREKAHEVNDILQEILWEFERAYVQIY